MTTAEHRNSRTRRVFIEDLILDAHIGCYDHEQGVLQPVRINIEMDVTAPDDPLSDKLEDVVCYNRLTREIDGIIAGGHIKLVETLAERIAETAVNHPMVISVRVSVAKPNAIKEARAAGVVVFRNAN